jgi:hypothetical protein
MLVREYSCGGDGNCLAKESAVKAAHGTIDGRPHHVVELAHGVSLSNLRMWEKGGDDYCEYLDLEAQKEMAVSVFTWGPLCMYKYADPLTQTHSPCGLIA